MSYLTLTERALDQMTGAELTALHNDLAASLGDAAVKRFATKADAIRRTWAKLQAWKKEKPTRLQRVLSEGRARPAPKQTKAATKPATKPAKVRKRRGTNLLPTGEPVEACREGSKQAILVDMLSREEGATMPELLDALSGGRKPWTEPTVRSGFGWDLKHKGYGVRSRFSADGVERFHLLVPEGQRIARHTSSGEPQRSAL